LIFFSGDATRASRQPPEGIGRGRCSSPKMM
jgi:hypothetical protein